MKIIIDEREAMLYELCVSMNQTLNMPIEKRVLELGDILFLSDDESVTHLIIERKSFADLLSSIKDGRYSEQSHRLKNCFPNPHNVVYLLEGMFSTVKNDADKHKIIACIASLNYFKGFSVLRTISMTETAQHIIYMADKIIRELKKGTVVENFSKGEGSNVAEPYCSVVKTSKKANITKENIGEIILCQIPGISSTTAVELMKPFQNFAEFMDKIRAEPAYLDGLTVNKRKLGSNIIKGIREFLVCI
jgi:ERCC4-type nuclease